MVASGSLSLVQKCATAADKCEGYLELELVEIPGSVELLEVLGSVLSSILPLLSCFFGFSSSFHSFLLCSFFLFFFLLFPIHFVLFLFFDLLLFLLLSFSRIAAHFALVNTLAPDTRLTTEVLLLGVALGMTCTIFFDMYLSSGSDSTELIPTDEGAELGVVKGVLVHTLELRVGDVLASPKADV